MAWISGKTHPSRPNAVRRCNADGCATLDSGGGVGPDSLARSEGGDLYWTRDGEPRAAQLD